MNEPMKFEDAVKERLKSIVADLIPEERWESLVRNTVSEFERVDLPALVKDMLKEQYKVILREAFEDPEWHAKWRPEGNDFVSDAVRKLIIDSAPSILAGMIGHSIQSAVQQMQYAAQGYR